MWGLLEGILCIGTCATCANRVALETCVQARNEGRDLAHEGNEIMKAVCKEPHFLCRIRFPINQ